MLTSSLGSNSGTRETVGRCPRCPPRTPTLPSNFMLKAAELRHPSPPLLPLADGKLAQMKGIAGGGEGRAARLLCGGPATHSPHM